MDKFDKFVEDLQRQIDEQTRRDYSPRAIELGQKPVNWGRMEDATASVAYEGPCGDTMEFFLKIDEDGKITDISFLTDGCVSSISSGSQATIMAKGKTVDEAHEITNEDILKELGRLPPDSLHCPVLAERTLKRAIEKYWTK